LEEFVVVIYVSINRDLDGKGYVEGLREGLSSAMVKED